MNKEEFRIYAEDSIMDITNRIDELRQRATNIDDKLRAEFDEKIVGLIESRDKLKKLITEFDSSGETTWVEFKKEFSEGLEHLQKSFQKLFNILST